MTRVESEVRTPEDREELKHEIEEELREETAHRRRRGCLIFLIANIIVFVLPLLWLATVAARTGLMHVPLLTSWLYAPAAPERSVVPLVGPTPTDVVNGIFARAKYDPENGLVTASASEQELTTLIRASGDGGGYAGSPFILDQAQVAIEDEHIEVAAMLAQADALVPVIVQARPFAKDGELQLELQKIVIGGYVVPDALVDTGYGVFGTQLLDALHNAVDDLGTVWRVQLTKGNVAVTFLPKSSPEDAPQ